MKYIRIKNGAVAVGDEEYNIKYIISTEDYLTKYFVDSRHIIAQADTIEELIDNYVFIEKGKMPVDFDKETITFNVGICLEDKTIVYGAIWTNKGLIYVAKMNDKGELELI